MLAPASGQVALPELRRCNYSPALATGALAAGGTLGILIPPSVVLVIYAILAEQNVAAMFMAALIPGLIAMLGYMVAVSLYARLVPGSGPASAPLPWRLRLRAVGRVWPILAVFITVIGGIYGGIFTPTEAAAVGTFATTTLAVISREMRWREFVAAVLGADVLNAFLALSQMPGAIAEWVLSSGYPPMLVLLAIIVVYLILGCVMDSLSMILLTIPVFLPIILGLDFWGLGYTDKAIWFGILALMVVEIGLITPPVGMNVFIINSLAKDVPMKETFRGVLPFLASDLLRIVLLAFFPGIALWLVHALGG